MADVLTRIWRFYADGFRRMTVGRSLWLLIIVKLVIIFAIIKLFFFPDILSTRYDSRARHRPTPCTTGRNESVLAHLSLAPNQASLVGAVKMLAVKKVWSIAHRCGTHDAANVERQWYCGICTKFRACGIRY